MEQYLKVVKNVLLKGNYKPNRTGVDTISKFFETIEINLEQGFPLITTKSLSSKRWNSLVCELIWYLTGEENIKELKRYSGIWNNWSDEQGHLQSSYGRFWRRYPVPEKGLPGEVWVDESCPWVKKEKDGTLVIDQVKRIIDLLKTTPNARRMLVVTWHPGNAVMSKLPTCHQDYLVNVQNNKLNLHLNQRSGDLALGVPFDIAAYSILTYLLAKETNYTPGIFAHSIADAHIYCGKGERGRFYQAELQTIKDKIFMVKSLDDYLKIREWILLNAPEEPEEDIGYDHVPGLLLQLSRKPRPLSRLTLPIKSIDDLTYDDAKDFRLVNYDPHPSIKYKVAE